jgi:hypothetical protein
MGKYFVPYEQNRPVAIEVKGHRLLVVASSPDSLLKGENLFIGDEIREIRAASNKDDVLASLAASINGGIVVAPPGMSMSLMLMSLEEQLPWVH